MQIRSLALLCSLVALAAACSSGGGSAKSAGGDAAGTGASTSTSAPPRCTVRSDLTTERIDLTVDGKPRYAWVHIPKGWNGQRAVPLLLSFHGLGANATLQRDSYGIPASADAHAYIAVFPNAGGTVGSFGAGWKLKGADDVRYVEALLARLESTECIDRSRVYASGLSYGGAMTDKLACELPHTFAAVAPVSAFLPARACPNHTSTPVISFHGVDDHLLPYKGGGPFRQVNFEKWGAQWAKRNGCDSAPTTTQYKATVVRIAYKGCRAPVVLYKVDHNGHTWPGHALSLDRAKLIDVFSGKTTGKPFPLMVAAGLTPEQFADTISLANTDIDATDMVWSFLAQHQLAQKS